jgi:hypothetical protein
MAFPIATNGVPRSLRAWFIIHFIVDIFAAVPLLIAPVESGAWLGFSSLDPLTTRLVAAALVAIGVESFLGRNATRASFHTMLRLKLLWSATAAIGTALAIANGTSQAAWAVFAIFAVFHLIWLRYFLLLHRDVTLQ